MRNLVIATFLAISLYSMPADASQFDTVGAGCLPGDPAVNSGRYAIASAAITHTFGNIDLITMYCPILTPIASPGTLELTYTSTENNASTYVKAQYIKMSLSTGAITTIAAVSSTSGTNNGTIQTVSTTFTDTFNFSSYAY